MISLEPRAAVIFRLTNMSSKNSTDKLDRIVSEARAAGEQREQGYRSKALKMYPWVCGRCAREFDEKNLRELTVHHRDHDHDNNPADGSNWELLCVYCHDNEHSRYVDAAYGDSATTAQAEEATHKPFADLASMLGKEK
jgi:5-methylcytosine-specific restriction endonuclease McrA